MSKLNDLLSKIIVKVNGHSTELSQLSADIAEIGTQEEIVQQVIAALGTPVFGRVESGNVIVLTGELGGGTYDVVYEDADGKRLEIGELSQQSETVVKIEWVYGVKIDSDTGAETSDGKYAKSQVFPVENGVTYRIDELSRNRFGLGVIYYDANGNFIERVKIFDPSYNGDMNDDTIDIVGPFEFAPSTHNTSGNAATFVLRGNSATSNNSFYDRIKMTCVRG